jgi:hypothetical protein
MNEIVDWSVVFFFMSSADQQNQARNGGFPAFLGIGDGGPIVHIRAVNYYVSVDVSRVTRRVH